MSEENKKTFSEKRTLGLQEKLNKLREKFENEPSKTELGKKIQAVRLERLSNMVDRRISKNNIEVLAQKKEFDEYEEYYSIQTLLMSEIGDLEFEKEKILKQLRKLEHLDVNSDKSMFAKNMSIVQKNMPKGYKPTTKNEETASKVEMKKQELKEKLSELENSIKERNDLLNKNDQEYVETVSKIKENLKNDLAVIKPNIFKKITNFLKDKKEKFNNWREQRKAKTDENLKNAINGAEKSSKRKMLLSNLDSGITPEEQLRISQEIQSELDEKRAANPLVEVEKEPEEQ